MSRSQRNKNRLAIDRRWLLGGLGLLVSVILMVNCGTGQGEHFILQEGQPGPLSASTANNESDAESKAENIDITSSLSSDSLWADTSFSDNISYSTPSPANISLNVRNANMLDVLSLLAHKLNVNVIFLGEPGSITIRTDNMSPTATLHFLLQANGLDYIIVGRNYIVGPQGRLYSDFSNQILLTRFGLTYVSASAMEGYLSNFGVSVQSLTIGSNQQALWMQGTPIELGKARQIINSLDVLENASFAVGGSRNIRLPVATATGRNAEEELEALIDLLSFLLDGVRDGRTDMGWVTWDHPDPIPRIYIDWESPVIKPYDIKMKITRDFANNPFSQLRYLIAEGAPDNIDKVSTMIARIAGTPSSPLSISYDPTIVSSEVTQWGVGGSEPVSTQFISYGIDLRAVPSTAGTLSGSGTYVQGSTVTVAAEPNAGYSFVRWIEGGMEISTDPLYTFTIYSNRRFEAVFVRENNSESETEDQAP